MSNFQCVSEQAKQMALKIIKYNCVGYINYHITNNINTINIYRATQIKFLNLKTILGHTLGQIFLHLILNA